MRAVQADPIEAAKAGMLRAAAHYNVAIREAQAAHAILEAHPDFARAVQLRRKGASTRRATTLAWWLADCIRGAVSDGADNAGRFLREDATGGAERSLRELIETEEQERREGLFAA